MSQHRLLTLTPTRKSQQSGTEVHNLIYIEHYHVSILKYFL